MFKAGGIGPFVLPGDDRNTVTPFDLGFGLMFGIQLIRLPGILLIIILQAIPAIAWNKVGIT